MKDRVNCSLEPYRAKNKSKQENEKKNEQKLHYIFVTFHTTILLLVVYWLELFD